MKSFLLGLVIGLLLVPAAVLVYLRIGHPPVIPSDPPLPLEAWLVRSPLRARIRREMPKTAPLEASAANLEIGAHVYRQQCAACHGLYGSRSDFAGGMYPRAPQLWQPHRNGVVGVSDDPPGQTYWIAANGIRLSGMPSFRKVLNDTQLWQVSLLLANADKPLPPDVLTLLKQPLDMDPGQQQPQAKVP